MDAGVFEPVGNRADAVTRKHRVGVDQKTSLRGEIIFRVGQLQLDAGLFFVRHFIQKMLDARGNARGNYLVVRRSRSSFVVRGLLTTATEGSPERSRGIPCFIAP